MGKAKISRFISLKHIFSNRRPPERSIGCQILSRRQGKTVVDNKTIRIIVDN